MKYLCLAYYNPAQFDAMSPAEMEAFGKACQPHDEDLKKTGSLLSVAALAPPAAAAVIRVKNGKPSITDGPYMETKEQLGSFFIIEAKDLNDAIRIASKHPGIQVGGEKLDGGIEVRAIESYE